MAVVADRSAPKRIPRATFFPRVLVGIDGSDASLEAVAQATRLLEPSGELTLFGAYTSEPTLVGGPGWATPMYLGEDADRDSATKRLDAVRVRLPTRLSVETRAARGRAWHELLREAVRAHDSLIAVGSHGCGGMPGTLLGSTATAIIHLAPCSVHVARPAPAAFPSSIVVGVDGSSQSLAAADVALALANRHGATMRALAATGEDPLDVDGLGEIVHRLESIGADSSAARHDAAPMLQWSRRPPVEALVEASATADLLVVGSRGLRQLAVLGSVSRRVAHQAHCSVLIVRDADADDDQLEATTAADAGDDTAR